MGARERARERERETRVACRANLTITYGRNFTHAVFFPGGCFAVHRYIVVASIHDGQSARSRDRVDTDLAATCAALGNVT